MMHKFVPKPKNILTQDDDVEVFCERYKLFRYPHKPVKNISLKPHYVNFLKKQKKPVLNFQYIDAWFKRSGIYDAKKFTETDAALTFAKFATQKMGLVNFDRYLRTVCKEYGLNYKSIRTELRFECQFRRPKMAPIGITLLNIKREEEKKKLELGPCPSPKSLLEDLKKKEEIRRKKKFNIFDYPGENLKEVVKPRCVYHGNFGHVYGYQIEDILCYYPYLAGKKDFPKHCHNLKSGRQHKYFSKVYNSILTPLYPPKDWIKCDMKEPKVFTNKPGKILKPVTVQCKYYKKDECVIRKYHPECPEPGWRDYKQRPCSTTSKK